MEEFFTSLTKRQTMLLLAGVTFGGTECLQSFGHLPEAEAELLRARAAAILAIPRDRRVPFLVQEIKRLLNHRRMDDLRTADPRWIAGVLRPERPATAEVILRALPGPVANRVREELNLAPTKLTREVRPDILAVIRWTFERQLERTLPKRAEFSMADLLTFDGREVLTLCDSLGAKALATAIAGLPAEERARFLDSLPPDQRELCARASSATSTHRLEADDARGVIARTTQGTTPSDALRLVGARRLARACVTHSPEFAAALIERQRGDFGRHLARFVSEERKQGARRGDQLLAEEVLAELERLSERGVIERPLRVGVPVMRPHPATATLPPRADGKTPVVKAPLPRRETVIAPGSGGDRPQRVEMPVLRVPPKPKPRGPSRGGR